VFYSRLFGLPQILPRVTFQTPIATIANSYTTLTQMQSFAVQANYSMSHPSVVLERLPETNTEVRDSFYDELYGASEMTRTGALERYRSAKNPGLAMAETVREFQRTSSQNANIYTKYYTDMSNNLINRIPLRKPIETSTFILPEKMKVFYTSRKATALLVKGGGREALASRQD
jgi:hypothetical protein